MTEQAAVGTKTLKGSVLRCSSDKTIKVVVISRKRHPLYEKTLTLKTVYTVHDASNVAKDGDVVMIKPCPPKSKSKTWELVSIEANS